MRVTVTFVLADTTVILAFRRCGEVSRRLHCRTDAATGSGDVTDVSDDSLPGGNHNCIRAREVALC